MNGLNFYGDVEGPAPMCAFVIPSARPPEVAFECIARWARAGYVIGLWRDQADVMIDLIRAACIPAIVLIGKYPGYAQAVNEVSKQVLHHHHSVQFVVAAGDDTDPSTVHPNIIASGLIHRKGDTFLVAQPTGDRWADAMGPIIDRIAGSPFIGREWCRRAHGGIGPYFPGLTHMGVDDAIKFAAEQEGVYMTLPDIGHLHHHFTRRGAGDGQDTVDWSDGVPPHLRWCNTPEHWSEFEGIFARFKMEYKEKWRPL